jgi:hypothetical protein
MAPKAAAKKKGAAAKKRPAAAAAARASPAKRARHAPAAHGLPATARGKQVHAGACDGQSARRKCMRQTPTPGPGPDDARTCATSPRGVPPGLRACAPCCAARVLLPGARAARVCCACTAAHAPTPALPTRVWSRACGARAVLCRRGDRRLADGVKPGPPPSCSDARSRHPCRDPDARLLLRARPLPVPSCHHKLPFASPSHSACGSADPALCRPYHSSGWPP